jgi:hypothetical protein
MRAARQAALDAERRFPVRIRIAIPDRGLGDRINQMHEWLDQNAGTDGWAMTPSGVRGVLNDALSIYLADATIATAFVARWCVGHKAEAADGLFRIREDGPTRRVGAAHHKIPLNSAGAWDLVHWRPRGRTSPLEVTPGAQGS